MSPKEVLQNKYDIFIIAVKKKFSLSRLNHDFAGHSEL